MTHRTIHVLIAVVGLVSSAHAQLRVPPLAGSESGRKTQQSFHTRATLVADTKDIRPGTPFTAGVLLKMDRGWHTYWSNPGETGLPTQIRWRLPGGFTAGEVQWPLPQKHIETGNVLTFGYDDETMLLVTITPSATLVPGSVQRLRADVNWLECERMCVPGNASLEITLPVSSGPARADNQELFSRYRALLPQPLPSAKDISLSTATGSRNIELSLKAEGGRRLSVVPDSTPDFYPGALDRVTIGRTAVVAGPGGAALSVPLSVDRKVNGPAMLHGVLVYQLESGNREAVGVDIPLSAEFLAGLPVAGSTAEEPGLLDRSFAVGQTAGQQPLALYLVFALIGGLLLNIMPCVLPVIALKVFGLVKMAGDQPGRIRKLGWFFSLGILASFLALALLVILLQTAGQQVGWGFQFQEPLFVIAMCALVFAFGLSLFGVFEIQVPSRAVAGVGRILERQEGKKGYASSFWEGVFATILATPCTAPFLGSALGFAFSQPAGVILLIFTCVALGMALPYLLLTTRPAWLKFLPKPGEWMVTARQFMGFLMMATLLWLLYVLGRQLGMEAVIWTCAFLLVIGVSCWLVGRFATLTASRKRFFTVWAAALLVAVAGYWVFLESALDVRSVIAGTSAPSQSAGTPDGRRIDWKPFSVPDVETYLKEDRVLFIDFTAEWCLTCKVNEHSVLTDPRVVEKFRTSNVTAVRADWTNRNPDITRLLSKFGRSGVPLYVIFPPGKPDAPIVLPEVITTSIVIDAIDRAGTPGVQSSNWMVR